MLDPPISFVADPPSREVYETCLGREFGEDFWDDFTGSPALTMRRCRA